MKLRSRFLSRKLREMKIRRKKTGANEAIEAVNGEVNESKPKRRLPRVGFFKKLRGRSITQKQNTTEEERRHSLLGNGLVTRQLDDEEEDDSEYETTSEDDKSVDKAVNLLVSHLEKDEPPSVTGNDIDHIFNNSDTSPPRPKFQVSNYDDKVPGDHSDQNVAFSNRQGQKRLPGSSLKRVDSSSKLNMVYRDKSPNFATGASKAENSNVVEDYDALFLEAAYYNTPILEHDKLPRGGLSIETEAVGRIQFGIPPETIKDSMQLGISVPTVYIVPMERFCREMGPSLGVNLAEFEFPAYYNFFIGKKRVQLIVDSDEAETNIKRVFGETLLGPAQFRREDSAITYEPEDFSPDFEKRAIPNFQKELKHFRIMPNGEELTVETLIQFCHFKQGKRSKKLGVPAKLSDEEKERWKELAQEHHDNSSGSHTDPLNPIFAMGFSKENNEVDIKNRSGKISTYASTMVIKNVSTVFPASATAEEKARRKCKRIEIFKEGDGTEYIVHDINEHNVIVGKVHFTGHVRVSESLGITGFEQSVPSYGVSRRNSTASYQSEESDGVPRLIAAPTFHAPSFGVTVLGNSHGFDKHGSTSGYVLWINGRGIMIDPPPYSSATLEREGIRPRTIVGIILTHCHADHDAGAFQKVLTGSPVALITTPTIYKSFIRKYAALSALSPALLRHSHRYKPAIIGTPLRFQGATFHFTYTLHTIPCVAFRVEWRGRSMVFTGDHFNSPPDIDKLQESGVFTKERADHLRNLPLQHCDLLLHEAGVPPIHTPIDVLMKLPKEIKDRLYVVHTSALPKGCELRVAPPGTVNTIRLDEEIGNAGNADKKKAGLHDLNENDGFSDDLATENMSASNYDKPSSMLESDYGYQTLNSNHTAKRIIPPLVALRPASHTDPWFILNLLSSVPFLTSLSYSSTMEVLDATRMDVFSIDDVVVPSHRRKDQLCVIWEGTCVERPREIGNRDWRNNNPSHPVDISTASIADRSGRSTRKQVSVWHAGDWTGPRTLQPEKRLSGMNSKSDTYDIVAMSKEGVKAITIEFSLLHEILKNGSALYRKYLLRKSQQNMAQKAISASEEDIVPMMKSEAVKKLNVIELLDCNSALRKLTAVQKRHLESLAEGPVYFAPSELLWKENATVDKAFILVEGTAAFRSKQMTGKTSLNYKGRQWSSKMNNSSSWLNPGDGVATASKLYVLKDKLKLQDSINEMRLDSSEDDSSISSCGSEEKQLVSFENILSASGSSGRMGRDDKRLSQDFNKIKDGFRKRADVMNKGQRDSFRDGSESSTTNSRFHDSDSIDSSHIDDDLSYQFLSRGQSSNWSDGNSVNDGKCRRMKFIRRRSSRDRFANKVLGRLYSQRIFTSDLVFSRGHFLGDVSKMVAGLLSHVRENDEEDADDDSLNFGYGDKPKKVDPTRAAVGVTVIHERAGDELVVHNTTLAAGENGCVVIMFPKASLIPFLDEYPGLLLSLLGTQVVV